MNTDCLPCKRNCFYIVLLDGRAFCRCIRTWTLCKYIKHERHNQRQWKKKLYNKRTEQHIQFVSVFFFQVSFLFFRIFLWSLIAAAHFAKQKSVHFRSRTLCVCACVSMRLSACVCVRTVGKGENRKFITSCCLRWLKCVCSCVRAEEEESPWTNDYSYRWQLSSMVVEDGEEIWHMPFVRGTHWICLRSE